jgi:iron complex outermembrane receptor protein
MDDIIFCRSSCLSTGANVRNNPRGSSGSMTVIDRELMRQSGARDVPEILRLVLG